MADKPMDFERYYIDLFEMLNKSCKKIASGKYDKDDVEWLLGMARADRFPGIFAELAESFGMMMVKVEAREFRLNQIIEELQETKAKLEQMLPCQPESQTQAEQAPAADLPHATSGAKSGPGEEPA